MSTIPSDPNLTRQPGTLAPNVKIEDDPPLAMGHNEEKAAEHAEANEEFKQALETEAETEDVGPRAPGDHAGSETEGSTEGSEVPTGTVEEVKEWVGDDPDRARQALEAERAGQNRSTLIAYLEEIESR